MVSGARLNQDPPAHRVFHKQNCAIFAPYAKKQAHAKPHKVEGKKQVQIERQTELVRGGCLESCLLASKLVMQVV